MLNKFMWICGVGVICGAAYMAVKEIKKEQAEAKKEVDVTEMDGTATKRVVKEDISFKEAAKRKVAKIHRKFILWAVDHIQDIQVYGAVLGLAGGAISVASEMRKFHNTSVINKRLDEILNNQASINHNVKFNTHLTAAVLDGTTALIATNIKPEQLTEELHSKIKEINTKAIDNIAKNYL